MIQAEQQVDVAAFGESGFGAQHAFACAICAPF
jgi:hypothetical protein